MATISASKLLGCIRTIALQQNGDASDGYLLDLYVRQKDESAFEVLVRRHSRMVLGVCRRILGNEHDAEDAFQATFLVLVRKAATIRPSNMVGNWLYGVAHRTALEARKTAAKRRAKETHLVRRPEVPDDVMASLRPLLDQELAGLPENFRSVVVLCDLEGKKRKEVAKQLGLPEGTVASRLCRARISLARRLTRHGVTISAGALATMLASEMAAASPVPLIGVTVKAATAYAAGPIAASSLISANVLALAEGVLRTMLLAKLKVIAPLVLLVIVGTGLGGMSYRTWANDRPSESIGRHQLALLDAPASAQPMQDKETKDQPKTGRRDYQHTPDHDAYLKAFQIGSEIARTIAKKSPKQAKATDPDQAKQVRELALKALEMYREAKEKDGKQSDKDPEADAFLKAFQVSSEIARIMAQETPSTGLGEVNTVENYSKAFFKAFARAKELKAAMDRQRGTDGRDGKKAVEALDAFLEAGKEFEQVIKQQTRSEAVRQLRREIESTLKNVEKVTNDKQTGLQTLEEIEAIVRELKTNLKKAK